jgi:deazaflavin-dependent oxidoreductase (nitroreductase family)
VTIQKNSPVRIPPRWFVRTAWVVHRGLYRVTRGRFGLSEPKSDSWGMMRVTTVGRRSGEERVVILGYYEDGAKLVTLAMNGWADPEPAWWLNLQANPDATVELPGDRRAMRARAAVGAERERLWQGMRDHSRGEDLDGMAALRSRQTAVVVFEPRPDA